MTRKDLLMETNTTPREQPSMKMLGTFWIESADLPDGWLGDSGRILVGDDSVNLGFESLDVLDGFIGRLTQIRYKIAVEQRDRATKARAAEHYGAMADEAQAQRDGVAV